MGKSSITNIIINFLLMMFSLSVCLIVFEIGLRLFMPQIIECPVNYEWRTDDEVLPYVPRSNYEGRMVLKDQFDITFHSNSAGFRGEFEVPVKRTENVERMAFIGDSFTFGWGVEDAETYCSLLGEHRRRDVETKGIEVLNAAVYGYDIIQYEEVLKRILKYRPDIIFVGFCLENDVNIVPLKSPGQETAKEHSSVMGVERRTLLSRVREFINSLHIVTLVRDRLYITFPKVRNIMLRMGINNKRDIFLREYTPSLCNSFRETENALCRMNDEAKAHGAEFIVILIPLKEQIYCRKEINSFSGYDIDSPNKRLIEILMRNNIDYIDILPEMVKEASISNERLYFDIDPHWTAAGHRIAQEIVYEKCYKKEADGEVTEAE